MPNFFGRPDDRLHDHLSLSNGEKASRDICHRTGVCGSIPYVKLFENLGRKLPIPISRILVGPSKNQNANFEAVHELSGRLTKNQGIKVQRSEIPYVGST